MSVTHTPLSKMTDASAEIAAHIAEFQRQGGKIEQIPTGMSAEAYEIVISEKTGKQKWRGLNGTEHMRNKNYGGKKAQQSRKTFGNGNKG